MSAWIGWERSLLGALGAPQTSQNIRFLDAWHTAEGSSASYNPMNTTQPLDGSTNYNSVGVQNFASASDGLQATVITLKNGNYPNILAALNSGDPFRHAASMHQDLQTWGTGSAWLSGSGASSAAPPQDPYSAVGALEAAGEFVIGGVETLGRDIIGAANAAKDGVLGGVLAPLKFTAGAIAAVSNVAENLGPWAIAIGLIIIGGMMLAQAHRDEFNQAHKKIADGVGTIGSAISKIAGEAVEVAPEVAAAGAAAAVIAL